MTKEIKQAARIKAIEMIALLEQLQMDSAECCDWEYEAHWREAVEDQKWLLELLSKGNT